MSYQKWKKRVNGWSISLTLIVIAWLSYGILRHLLKRGILRTKEERAIIQTFTGTRYEKLIPFIIAQAKHETAGFSRLRSTALAKNNNMFGMNRPYSRPTTDNGKGDLLVEGSVMANYDSLKDSAQDLKLWFDQFNNNPFPSEVDSTYEYASELKGSDKGRINYYTDSIINYSTGLGRWI